MDCVQTIHLASLLMGMLVKGQSEARTAATLRTEMDRSPLCPAAVAV